MGRRDDQVRIQAKTKKPAEAGLFAWVNDGRSATQVAQDKPTAGTFSKSWSGSPRTCLAVSRFSANAPSIPQRHCLRKVGNLGSLNTGRTARMAISTYLSRASISTSDTPAVSNQPRRALAVARTGAPVNARIVRRSGFLSIR